MSSAATAAPKPFCEMDDAMFTTELRRIIVASRSTDEVQQRLLDELGYPYSIAITSQKPVSTFP